jgi:hypothetical protein
MAMSERDAVKAGRAGWLETALGKRSVRRRVS